MKHFECGSLVPGCKWHTRHDDVSEVVRSAVAHLRSSHQETNVRPDMIDRIKQRIVDVEVEKN